MSANGTAVVSQPQWEAATALNQWQRLQISYDGAGTTSVYIDGALISAVAGAPEVSRDGGWSLVWGTSMRTSTSC